MAARSTRPRRWPEMNCRAVHVIASASTRQGPTPTDGAHQCYGFGRECEASARPLAKARQKEGLVKIPPAPRRQAATPAAGQPREQTQRTPGGGDSWVRRQARPDQRNAPYIAGRSKPSIAAAPRVRDEGHAYSPARRKHEPGTEPPGSSEPTRPSRLTARATPDRWPRFKLISARRQRASDGSTRP